MSGVTDSAQSKTLDQREHNEDASAKRVVTRYQNPTNGNWYNYVPAMVSGVDYDYLAVQQTDPTTETLVFKTGGSGGTTVKTIVFVYTDSSKATISSITWS